MSIHNFSVVLYPAAATDLHAVLAPWLKYNELLGPYINCKEADPSGPYFRFVMDFPETSNEFEIQIPHMAIKSIVRSTELRRLGFV